MAGKKDVTAYKRPHKLKYGKWGLIFILPVSYTHLRAHET